MRNIKSFSLNIKGGLATHLFFMVLGVQGSFKARQIAVAEQGFPSDYGLYIIIGYNNYYLHLFSDMQSNGIGNNLYWAHTNSSTVPSTWKRLQFVSE